MFLYFNTRLINKIYFDRKIVKNTYINARRALSENFLVKAVMKFYEVGLMAGQVIHYEIKIRTIVWKTTNSQIPGVNDEIEEFYISRKKHFSWYE